ncbi:flagellar hook-length control protein FliK [Chitinilyticum litopenaei]|uniref:flagellar hook-length control protein FliK n=1 Tax=Chitinilyticum litopenaei TaxID=1121276 RepID=UPI00130DCCD3|nr:flagellar hook-length control protein FliK [Chitinilyticum litopenaei]
MTALPKLNASPAKGAESRPAIAGGSGEPGSRFENVLAERQQGQSAPVAGPGAGEKAAAAATASVEDAPAETALTPEQAALLAGQPLLLQAVAAHLAQAAGLGQQHMESQEGQTLPAEAGLGETSQLATMLLPAGQPLALDQQQPAGLVPAGIAAQAAGVAGGRLGAEQADAAIVVPGMTAQLPDALARPDRERGQDLSASFAGLLQGLPQDEDIEALAGEKPGSGSFAVTTPLLQEHKSTASQESGRPQAHIPEPVGSGRWGDAIAQRVGLMLGKQEQQIDMQLNPPHLGPMEVRLNLGGEQASVVFTSQHAAVREALAAATPRLTALLADQGIHLVDVQVASDSLQQQQQQQQQAAQQQASRQGSGHERHALAYGARLGGDGGVSETVLSEMRVPVARSGVSLYV